MISTAIKKGVAKQPWIDAAVESMTTLNKVAAEVTTGVETGAGGANTGISLVHAEQGSYSTFEVHALTDVTGFGLIGHAREMAIASNVSLRMYAGRIPLLQGALDCVRAGYIPGGLKANREFAECLVEYDTGVSEEIKTILFDPQTAGGLLIAVSPDDSASLTAALIAAGVPAVEIGEVTEQSKPAITVLS